jgi:chromosome segregation ATPase
MSDESDALVRLESMVGRIGEEMDGFEAGFDRVESDLRDLRSRPPRDHAEWQQAMEEIRGLRTKLELADRRSEMNAASIKTQCEAHEKLVNRAWAIGLLAVAAFLKSVFPNLLAVGGG